MTAWIRFCTAALLLGAAGCAPESADTQQSDEDKNDMIRISGEVTYRQRMLLRPGYTLKVTLSDVSVADRAAPVLAKQSRTLADEQIPLPFELTIARDQLQPRGRYSVRAVLLDPDGNLAFTTDTAALIDPASGAPAQQDLITLRMVAVAAGSSGTPDLAGTIWQVDDVANAGIIDNANITLEFTAEGQLAGSAGCNRYTGPFTADDGQLSAGEFAVTRKACAPALMNLEQRFLDTLRAAASYTVSNQGVLIITTADGRSLRATKRAR